jgi:hypothetical protein
LRNHHFADRIEHFSVVSLVQKVKIAATKQKEITVTD